MPAPGFKFHWHKAYGKSDVPSVARSVAYIVFDYTGADGEHGYPGMDILMKSTGLSRSTVIRNLKTNTDAGWLVLVKSGSRAEKRNWKSEYRLSYPTDHVSSVIPDAVEPPVDEIDHVSSTTPDQPDLVSSTHGPCVTHDTPTDPDQILSLSDPVHASSFNPEGKKASASAGRDGREVTAIKALKFDKLTQQQIQVMKSAGYVYDDWDDRWHLPKF